MENGGGGGGDIFEGTERRIANGTERLLRQPLGFFDIISKFIRARMVEWQTPGT